MFIKQITQYYVWSNTMSNYRTLAVYQQTLQNLNKIIAIKETSKIALIDKLVLDELNRLVKEQEDKKEND